MQTKMWFKDSLKRSFGTCHVDHHRWSTQAKTCEAWCLTTKPVFFSFENTCRSALKDKKSRRRNTMPSSPDQDLQLRPLNPCLCVPHQPYQSRTCLQSVWTGPFLIFISQSHEWIYIYISKLVSWPTVVKGDPKAPFSTATILRCREGRYSFPWITPLILYSYFLMLNVKQGGVKYHFFEPLVWLDVGLSPSLLDYRWTLYRLWQWFGIK